MKILRRLGLTSNFRGKKVKLSLRNIEEDRGREGGWKEGSEINFSIFPHSSSPGLGHLSYYSVSPHSRPSYSEHSPNISPSIPSIQHIVKAYCVTVITLEIFDGCFFLQWWRVPPGEDGRQKVEDRPLFLIGFDRLSFFLHIQ